MTGGDGPARGRTSSPASPPSRAQAVVDVLSSEGWLKPATAAMDLSQMLVQGVWANRDEEHPVLMQVPHMTPAAAAALAALGEGEGEAVESVYALAAMDAGLRQRTLGFSSVQLADVAAFCNRYPNVDVTFELEVRRGGGWGAP